MLKHFETHEVNISCFLYLSLSLTDDGDDDDSNDDNAMRWGDESIRIEQQKTPNRWVYIYNYKTLV